MTAFTDVQEGVPSISIPWCWGRVGVGSPVPTFSVINVPECFISETQVVWLMGSVWPRLGIVPVRLDHGKCSLINMVLNLFFQQILGGQRERGESPGRN